MRPNLSSLRRAPRAWAHGLRNPKPRAGRTGASFMAPAAVLDVEGRNGRPSRPTFGRSINGRETLGSTRTSSSSRCAAPSRGHALAPNAESSARRVGAVVETTAQVFVASRQKQAETFDEDAFWRVVLKQAVPSSYPSRLLPRGLPEQQPAVTKNPFQNDSAACSCLKQIRQQPIVSRASWMSARRS